MQQNLVSIAVSKALQTSLIQQVAHFKQQLPDLISLTNEERRSLTMMGPKSENFARLALVSMQQNPALIPRGIDLDAAFADLEARDNLIPVLKALQSLVEEIEDTVSALGSDVMVVANIGYGLMKSAGGGAGLDEAVRELSYRHRKRARKSEKPEGDSAK